MSDGRQGARASWRWPNSGRGPGAAAQQSAAQRRREARARDEGSRLERSDRAVAAMLAYHGVGCGDE